MITDWYEKCKDILFQIVNCLSGSDKRIQAAALSNAFGRGGQSFISKELNMSRDTIRKGQRELAGNFRIIDKHHAKGRKKAEYKLPLLLEDIRSIVDSQSQTDPNFKTTRLFTRLTICELRKQLVLQKRYTDEELPTNQTLLNKVNGLGYKLTKVKKVKPLKKIEETDLIFEKIAEVRKEYEERANAVIIYSSSTFFYLHYTSAKVFAGGAYVLYTL